MRQFEIGKLFEEGKTRYQEGCKFDFTNAGGNLFIFFENPTAKEIKSIKDEEMKAGLFCKDEIIFLLWEFGSMEWMDTPYTVHLSKNLVLENIGTNMGYAVTIMLINATNGILEAIRYISFSEKLSKEFYKSVQIQRIDIFTEERYSKKLDAIYTQYTTKDMIKFGMIERIGKNG